MPHYFFDVDDGVTRTTDDTGLALSGIEAARAAAVGVLPDVARDALSGANFQEIMVVVRDEAGERVLTARLVLAVEQSRMN